MARAPVLLAFALATALVMVRCTNSQPEHRTANPAVAPTAPASSQSAVPPYHEGAEAARAQVLSPDNFKDSPAIAQVYRIAARIREVLVQQPCYCHCERMGHGSLLDCFASDHGAG